MKHETILILGARSGMAIAIAHQFASVGHSIQLAARNLEELQPMKSDLELRYGIQVSIHEFDVLATDSHSAFIEKLPKLPDIAICAVGVLADQVSCDKDPVLATSVIRTNFEGPAIIFTLLANHFEQRGSGILIGISSVSGLRGRTKQAYYEGSEIWFFYSFGRIKKPIGKEKCSCHNRITWICCNTHDGKSKSTSTIDCTTGRGSTSDHKSGKKEKKCNLRTTYLANNHVNYSFDSRKHFQKNEHLIIVLIVEDFLQNSFICLLNLRFLTHQIMQTNLYENVTN